MALFKKNIWSLFIALSIGSLFFLGLISYFRWQNIQSSYLAQQHSLVQLISHASHSLFVNQEMVLDILGNELVKDQQYKSSVHSKRILNELLRLNQDIVGFGLATPDGQLTVVSANLSVAQLPNLKDQPASRDSFLYALTQNKMVLGRTYFMPALNDWIIPIRKAIRNADNEVVAVMTAGLRLKGAAQFFNNEIHTSKHNRVSLIRERDRYIQFRSSQTEVSQETYTTPINDKIFDSAIQAAVNNEGKTLEDLKVPDQSYDFWLTQQDGSTNLSVVRFDPRYELWIVSDIQKSKMVDEFVFSVLIYLFVFAVEQLILFLLFRSIDHDETGRRQALIYQAQHDLLTGLPNRNYLQSHIPLWTDNSEWPFHLLYIDMDNFKSVNDNFGHFFGDEVLKILSQRLRNILPQNSTLIRQGGDEFIILTANFTEETVQPFAKRIIQALAAPCQVNSIDFNLGASVGVAQYPIHGKTLDDLLKAADIAMYEAKKYKNSIRLYTASMHDSYSQKMHIEQHLQGAVERNELFMMYQPQVDINGQFIGVEALVRWQSAELGFVPPDQFIKVAESCGLMPKLGQFIINTTLQEIRQLQVSQNHLFHLAINISIRQFMQAHFIDQLQSAIAHSQIEHRSITLEITENLFIEDLDYILPLLTQIHSLGMQISMDDFGTGYSSLSMLRTLPIDELKIDKSFIDNLIHSEPDRKLVQNIIAIGKNYNMTVLAEGVETEEQAALLGEMNCDRFQGYRYAKPMRINQLEEYVSQHNQRSIEIS